MAKINKRESSALVNSLTAGVVPRIGLRHIAVGRVNEVGAFLKDLETIEDGGASFRIVAGQYGSGKSFLLQMIRNNAMERNFVVGDVDLSPERRLTGTKGQGLTTYKDLMQNIATNIRPEGGAVESILQKWINNLQNEIALQNGLQFGDPAFVNAVSRKINEVLQELSEMAYGFAFSKVIESYWIGYSTDNDELKQSSLRWIRGEFANKTEAKKNLPVDCIIDDQSWYEFLKLFALFVKKAGYKGMFILLDECVNLYKITNKQSRDNNYEKILTIFNDTMQGKAQYIGICLSGTTQFVYDERRGLFNYEALRSRLADNSFGNLGVIDYSSPVIKLNQLTNEELFILLERLCEVHSTHYGYENTLTSEELLKFIEKSMTKIGANELLTPREITRDFMGLLNILQQNHNMKFTDIISSNEFKIKSLEVNPDDLNDDLFAEFDI